MSTPFASFIHKDHETIYTLRDKYFHPSSKTHPQYEKQQLALQLLWEISRHIAAEELLIHPWYTKALDSNNGSRMRDFDRNDHQEFKNKILLLLSLNLQPGDPEFDSGIEKITGDTHRHNDSEEQSDIPMLVSAMSTEDNSNLAKELEKTKEFYIPERFRLGAGTNITTTALKAALKFPANQLRKDFDDYLSIEGRGFSHN